MPSTIRVVLTCQGFEHTTSRVIFFNQSSVEMINFESEIKAKMRSFKTEYQAQRHIIPFI